MVNMIGRLVLVKILENGVHVLIAWFAWAVSQVHHHTYSNTYFHLCNPFPNQSMKRGPGILDPH